MRTHVALLRGVNVGGRNRLAMADLRAVVEGLGFSEVATYIQSGNVVFGGSEAGSTELALALERAIAGSADVRPGVVVLSREELVAVVSGNPYPDETNPKNLHVAFHRGPLGADAVATLREAEQQARAKGSRDEGTIDGSTLYLRTPDGLGRSELAVLLGRPRGPLGAQPVSTMRNWATVTKVLALLDE